MKMAPDLLEASEDFRSLRQSSNPVQGDCARVNPAQLIHATMKKKISCRRAEIFSPRSAFRIPAGVALLTAFLPGHLDAAFRTEVSGEAETPTLPVTVAVVRRLNPMFFHRTGDGIRQ
jgi:hypothetical protein